MDIPHTFQLIDVPLPPMLLAMAGVKGESRFVSLHYQGSKATWTDRLLPKKEETPLADM